MVPHRGVSRAPKLSSNAILLRGFLVLVFAVALASLLILLILAAPQHEADADERVAQLGMARSANTVAPEPSAATPPSVSTAAAANSCSGFDKTELGGDVVRWGADHKLRTSADCCNACADAPKCNVWVHCGDATLCGELYQQCWLKALSDPWADLDALRNKSGRWTSGITGVRPTPSASSSAPPPAPASPPDFAIITDSGEFRVRLFADSAPLAADFIRAVLRVAPGCHGCRFYRAEPVPPNWGSLDSPDSWNGGRWGPPYALLQGSFLPSKVDGGTGEALPGAPLAETSQRARPLIRRGMIAWAGGGGGPEGFVALADHPEWGHGHTVWGEVMAEDMGVIDVLMREREIKVENWGSINASVFVTPLQFRLRKL